MTCRIYYYSSTCKWDHLSKLNVDSYRTSSRYSSLIRSDLRIIKFVTENTVNVHSGIIKTTATRAWNPSNFEWRLPSILRIVGCFSSYRDTRQSYYRLSLRLQALFTLKMFYINVMVRQPARFSSPLITSIILQVRHYVQENSPIIVACRSGEIPAVWDLLESQQASINDVTPTNKSLLAVSKLYVLWFISNNS